MIVYHPIYDSYHCLTRLLKILNSIEKRNREIDRIKIYDYYFLFPNEISSVTLPHEFSRYKKIEINNRYNKVQNSKHTFLQLQGVQDISFKAMAAYGFIDKLILDKDIIMYIDSKIPEGLLFPLTDKEKEYLEFVSNFFEVITLKELKQRTKIMDHRYELT